jgi:hypothetical protein
VAKGPAAAGLEVGVPVDLCAEVGGPRAEQVEAVGSALVGSREDVLAEPGLEGRDRRQGGQHRSAQRPHRIRPCQRCRQLAGAGRKRAAAEHDIARNTAGEACTPAPKSRRSVPESGSAELRDSVGQAGPHYVAGVRPATQRSCQTLTL